MAAVDIKYPTKRFQMKKSLMNQTFIDKTEV